MCSSICIFTGCFLNVSTFDVYIRNYTDMCFYLCLYRCNGTINHCIIYETERGYGFAEPYNIYGSLKALVLHYAQNSLEEHNDSLTTTLAFPVFANSSGSSSAHSVSPGFVAFNHSSTPH